MTKKVVVTTIVMEYDICKEILVIKDPLEVEVQLENVELKGLEVLLVKWDLLEVKGISGHAVKKVARWWCW